jgi:OOP family OmpA-OmpF porin
MKSTAILAVLGLAAAAFAAPAAAQTTRGGYLGFSAGQSDFKFTGCTSPCDSKGRDYKLFGGFQFNRYAALEVGYSDMGKTTFGASRLKANALELSGVGTWGVPMGAGGMGLSLLGRLGIYNGDVKSETPSTGATLKHGTTDLTFGFGLQADLSRILAVRAEWQRFSKMGGGGLGTKADIDALTVGALWRF